MRILIYGAGAIGCYIGGRLAAAGHAVTLIGRQPLAEAVQAEGLRVTLADGTQHTLTDVTVVTSFEEAWQTPAYDWVAFTMKANDTVQALMEMNEVLGFGAPEGFPPIVSFQNGFGSEASITSAFGEGAVIAATTTTPVSLPEAGMVVQEKARGVGVAMGHPQAVMVATALEGAGFDVTRYEAAAPMLWSKLLMNVVANATCAILDMPPAAVYADDRLVTVEHIMLQEIVAIMELSEIEVVDLPGMPARRFVWLVRGPRWLFSLIMRRRVAGARGDKLPSLLLALRSGKNTTEVPFLNGAVVQKADEIERIVPVNHTLALLVSDIVTGRTPWEVYKGNPEMLLTAIRASQGMADNPF